MSGSQQKEISMNISLLKTHTVEPRSNGPVSNGNPLVTKAIPKFLEKIFFFFYIGNNRYPPVTDKGGWSHKNHQKMLKSS